MIIQERENQRRENLSSMDQRALERQESLERAVRKSELEQSVRETRKEQAVVYAQAVGKALVPIAVGGGITIASSLLSNQFENHNLQNLVYFGLSFGAGLVIGVTGMTSDYMRWFKGTINDIRYNSQRVKDYRTQIKTLEQQV